MSNIEKIAKYASEQDDLDKINDFLQAGRPIRKGNYSIEYFARKTNGKLTLTVTADGKRGYDADALKFLSHLSLPSLSGSGFDYVDKKPLSYELRPLTTADYSEGDYNEREFSVMVYYLVKPSKTASTKTAMDEIFKKMETAIKGQSLMNLRKSLESIFPKKDIDFSYSPEAHYKIKYKGKNIIIVNKKYAEDAELIITDMAIGYEGKI